MSNFIAYSPRRRPTLGHFMMLVYFVVALIFVFVLIASSHKLYWFLYTNLCMHSKYICSFQELLINCVWLLNYARVGDWILLSSHAIRVFQLFQIYPQKTKPTRLYLKFSPNIYKFYLKPLYLCAIIQLCWLHQICSSIYGDIFWQTN